MQFGCDWPAPGSSVVLAELRGNRGKSNHRNKSCTTTTVTAATTTRPLKPATSLDVVASPLPTPSHQKHQPQGTCTHADTGGKRRRKPANHQLQHYYDHQVKLLHQQQQEPHLPASIDVSYTTPCRNSLLLSRRDRVLLEYFPASTIFCIHSSMTKRRSPLQYIYQITAGSSSMVMHMIMAYSAGELHRKNKGQRCDALPNTITATTTGTGTGTGTGCDLDALEAAELYHYAAALRELQDFIKSTNVGDGDNDDQNEKEMALTRFEENFDAIMSAIFIMIYYGMQSMSSLGHARTHIAGLASLVATYVRARNKRTSMAPPNPKNEGHSSHGFSALSSLLLLWLLYADIIGHPYGLSLDLLSVFGNNDARHGSQNGGRKRHQLPSPPPEQAPEPPLLDPGQLFRDARLGINSLWGRGTCTTDLQDSNNMRVFRGLEMAHHVQLLRARISKARAAPAMTNDDYPSLMSELLLLQETYRDVFDWAHSTTFAEIKGHNIDSYSYSYNSDSETHSNSSSTTFASTETTEGLTPDSKRTAHHAAEITTKLITHYWAAVLFCRRWLLNYSHNPPPGSPSTPTSASPSPSTSDEAIRLHAISCIVARLPPGPDSNPNAPPTAKERKEMLIRYAWPTFMAAIETDDAAQRGDLLARLSEVRDASAECQWCWETAREIVRMQGDLEMGQSGEGQEQRRQKRRACWVDLAQFMQRQYPVGLG